MNFFNNPANNCYDISIALRPIGPVSIMSKVAFFLWYAVLLTVCPEYADDKLETT
jgi:hypothetical protein